MQPLCRRTACWVCSEGTHFSFDHAHCNESSLAPEVESWTIAVDLPCLSKDCTNMFRMRHCKDCCSIEKIVVKSVHGLSKVLLMASYNLATGTLKSEMHLLVGRHAQYSISRHFLSSQPTGFITPVRGVQPDETTMRLSLLVRDNAKPEKDSCACSQKAAGLHQA